MHADRTNRIVNAAFLPKEHAEDDEDTGHCANDECAYRSDEGAGRGDGHESCQHAVAHHAGIGLAVLEPHVEDAAQGGRHTGDHGVHGNDTDATVATGQRAAGVESEPAERQDERAELNHGNVMAEDGPGLAVLVVLADARTNEDGCNERQRTALQVDDT